MNKRKKKKVDLTKYLIMEEEEEKSIKEKRKKKKKDSSSLENIAKAYNKINQTLEGIYHDFGSIEKLVEALVNTASENMLNEDDDWFDKVTVKRNQKELNKRGKDFVKAFNEVKNSSLRLQALHEEIGFILDRYFKLGDK